MSLTPRYAKCALVAVRFPSKLEIFSYFVWTAGVVMALLMTVFVLVPYLAHGQPPPDLELTPAWVVSRYFGSVWGASVETYYRFLESWFWRIGCFASFIWIPLFSILLLDSLAVSIEYSRRGQWLRLTGFWVLAVFTVVWLLVDFRVYLDWMSRD